MNNVSFSVSDQIINEEYPLSVVIFLILDESLDSNSKANSFRGSFNSSSSFNSLVMFSSERLSEQLNCAKINNDINMNLIVFFMGVQVVHNFLYIQLIRTISSKSRNNVQFNWILYCKTNEIILFYKSSNGLLIRCISLLSLNCCVPIILEYKASQFRSPKDV